MQVPPNHTRYECESLFPVVGLVLLSLQGNENERDAQLHLSSNWN